MMRLEIIYKNIVDKLIYFSVCNFPQETTKFRIYFTNDETHRNFNFLAETTNPFYSDYDNFKYSILNNRVTYRVDAINLQNNVIDSIIFHSDMQPSELMKRTTRVLARQAEIALRNSKWSKQGFLIKKLRNGTRCACYSLDLRSSSDPMCNNCYGTGFVGGFYDPLLTYMFPLKEDVKRREINEYIPTAYDLVTCVMPTFPLVVEDDFLAIDGVGVYKVIRVSGRSILTAKTPTSLVQLSLLTPDHIIYKYPLNKKITNVDSIEQDNIEPNKIIISGDNLLPFFGEVKLLIYDGLDKKKQQVLSHYDLLSKTKTQLIFNTSFSEKLNEIKYRFRLNGLLFTNI